MDLKKAILRSAGDRTKLIDNILKQLEKTVQKAQQDMLSRFVEDWVDKLDTDEDGNIKNTLYNKRLLQTVDTVFEKFVVNEGVEVAKSIAEGVSQVVDFNGAYYKLFTAEAQLAKIHPTVNELVKSWLGLKGNGQLEGNGYLSKLINDASVRNVIKDVALKSVVSQRGYKYLKNSLKELIIGTPEKLGALQKYYRNFAYDTISKVDRATSTIYATALKMDYAIYEGGLIDTSRKFCKEHSGKVYTRKEISEFEPKEAIPEPYDPFTDLGGFGCRHHLNWIPQSVAYALRPELRELEKAA